MPADATPLPPGRFAVRPEWSQLPLVVRRAVDARLGSPVITATSAEGGFTSGFAGVLSTAAGRRVFVKAAALASHPHLADWLAREAAVTAALPATVPAPRPIWAMAVADHFVLALTAIDGRTPGSPWLPTDLSAVLAAYARVSETLREPPAAVKRLGLPGLAALAWADLSWWREVADGREPAPEGLAVAGGSARLPDLVALESLLPRYAATTTQVIHCDLRPDNVMIDSSGQVWFCDWTWLCHGPAWFDLTHLLIPAYGDGLPVDALFADHPAARGAPTDALDSALAALSGYWLTSAANAAGAPMAGAPMAGAPRVGAPRVGTSTGGEGNHVEPAGSRASRLSDHHRHSGERALAWLADRRGWR